MFLKVYNQILPGLKLCHLHFMTKNEVFDYKTTSPDEENDMRTGVVKMLKCSYRAKVYPLNLPLNEHAVSSRPQSTLGFRTRSHEVC